MTRQKKKLFSANNGSDPTPNGRLRNREGMPVIAPAAAVVQAEVSLGRRRERDAAGGGLSWFPTKGRKRAQIGQTDKTMSTDLRFDSSPYQSQSRDGYRPGDIKPGTKNLRMCPVLSGTKCEPRRGENQQKICQLSYEYGMILRCTSRA